MALNKAHTSIWVKALIIVLIIAFVSLFMYQGFAGILNLFNNPQNAASTTVDSLAAINEQNQSIVDPLKALVASNPTSYTANVELANAYFDWAQALSQPLPGQTQLSTAAMAAAVTQWGLAQSAYASATALAKTFDPATQTDRSYAVFAGSNDASAAIAIVKVVTEKAPTFAQAWVHLGIYYEAQGKNALAVSAYQRFVTLNPKGDDQTVSYVVTRLKALGGSVPSTKTP